MQIVPIYADLDDILPAAARAFRTWCVNNALPRLAETGRDARGLWYEDLDHNGVPLEHLQRRVRVQSRQIYGYAAAASQGWYPAGQSIAQDTWAALQTLALSPDGRAGYVHRVNADYSVQDELRDFYDHAFHLLGLAALGTAQAQSHADALLDFLDTDMSAPLGHQEGVPASLPRRQNPHMHLFEALMALYQSFGAPKYLARAKDIFTLFTRRFYDAQNNSVIEYFDADLQPLSGKPGRSREPGHAAEWIWLLGQYEKLTGTDTARWRNALYRRLLSDAGRYIWLIDERDAYGPAIRATRRLWVQTELVKAHLTQAEFGMPGARDMAASSIFGLLNDYLTPDGLWRDQFDITGKMIAKAVPISSFYHIICCALEAERVSRLPAQDQRNQGSVLAPHFRAKQAA